MISAAELITAPIKESYCGHLEEMADRAGRFARMAGRAGLPVARCS